MPPLQLSVGGAFMRPWRIYAPLMFLRTPGLFFLWPVIFIIPLIVEITMRG